MKHCLKTLFALLIVLTMAGSFIYGGWRITRWWNYKLSYQSQVQKEIKPLVERIDQLEKRVEQLEKK